MTKLTGFELTRGALGAFRRPQLPSVADIVRGARRITVLEDITNHTNVGAIFRSAAALGIDAVLVTPACYDPLYRRAVRVSMGTVFQVPWTRIGEEAGAGATGTGGWAPDGVPLLHELGFKTAAFALTDDSVRHRGRRPRARHHRPLRLHRAHPHGLRGGLAQRGRRQRRSLLAAAPVG